MPLKGLFSLLAASAFLAVPQAAAAQSAWMRAPGPEARYAEAQSSYYEARRAAYDRGYREGVRHGEQDARRGDRFYYQDERDFQRGDKGYHRSYGNRDQYRQIFRDGFATGYSNGYSRLSRSGRYSGQPGRYPPQGPYRGQGGYGGPGTWGGYGGAYYSPAFDNGARDGYEKGQEDARKERSYDPLRHSWYRSGDRHYERRYGSRDEYKDVYRRGFQQGYERGYREGRYRW